MKKKFLCKCLVSLGLLLFLAFVPNLSPAYANMVQASDIEKEKNEYRLNLRSVTLVNGKSFTLKVYNLEEDAKVTYKSANPDIASVNEDGTITAQKVGTTTITATVKRGNNTSTLNCDITIGPPAFSVKMTRSMVILGLDQNDLLEVIIKPSNTAELAKFSSYDSSIVSVSSGGRITARKIGMTYVFAEIDATNPDGNRKFASCKVIVCNHNDVTPLKSYLSSHPEFSLVSETDFSKALFEFFNNNTSVDILQLSGDSLIEALNDYLNSKFDLTELKKKYNEIYQPAIEAQ